MNGTCGSLEYSSTTLLHGYVEFCSLKINEDVNGFFFLVTVALVIKLCRNVYLSFKRMNL